MTPLPRPTSTVLGILALLATFSAGPVAAQADPAAFVGHWQGELGSGARMLPILFHLTLDGEALTATMDSPAQGAVGVPMDPPEFRGDTLVLRLRVAGATYTGVLEGDGDSMVGTWAQGPGRLPLTMARVTEAEAQASAMDGLEAAAVTPEAQPTPEDRPQTPRPPFPYAAEDVRFPSAAPGVELAGTLTIPPGDGPFPGVVLVSGSGPQDRDETLLGHKPFAVLADYLTRQGIAVLRYDDRGVGESGGEFRTATSVEFSMDAEGAVGYLAARPQVRADAVGIAGHSEGGLIGPMVAARSGSPAFLVLLAGPGTPGSRILVDQARLIGLSEGVPADMLEKSLEVNRELFRILENEADLEVARARIQERLRERISTLSPEERQAVGVPEGQEEAFVQGQAAQLATPWFRFFVVYDPVDALRATSVPVLAVNGELDLQVPAEANLEAIRTTLEEGGNDDVTTLLLPGLNHLFQEAETGSPSEYSRIDQTMSPEVMRLVADWILERFGSA